MLKNWRIWLGLLISLAFLYWVLGQVEDFGRLTTALREAQYGYLAPAIVVYFIGVWLRTIRWHFLLRPNKHVSWRRLFPVVVIGYMANDVLPARMGEFVRAYVLSQKEDIRKSTCLATIVLERVFDGLAMLSFLAIVGLLFSFSPTVQSIAIITGSLFVSALAVLLLTAARPAAAERLVGRILPLLPHRFRQSVQRMACSALLGLKALRSGRAVLAVFGLSLGAWTMEAGMYYLVGLGFFSDLPLPAVLLTVAVANLGTMIPSSPGYVGTFHALVVFSLALFGLGGETALAFATVLHATLVIPVTLWGFYYLWRENLSFGRLTSARAASLSSPTVD